MAGQRAGGCAEARGRAVGCAGGECGGSASRRGTGQLPCRHGPTGRKAPAAACPPPHGAQPLWPRAHLPAHLVGRLIPAGTMTLCRSARRRCASSFHLTCCTRSGRGGAAGRGAVSEGAAKCGRQRRRAPPRSGATCPAARAAQQPPGRLPGPHTCSVSSGNCGASSSCGNAGREEAQTISGCRGCRRRWAGAAPPRARPPSSPLHSPARPWAWRPPARRSSPARPHRQRPCCRGGSTGQRAHVGARAPGAGGPPGWNRGHCRPAWASKQQLGLCQAAAWRRPALALC